ncbi:MAG: hypothetical protein ACRD0A_03095 [Acidimicrobiales bacterium]
MPDRERETHPTLAGQWVRCREGDVRQMNRDAFGLADKGVAIVGNIPSGLPAFNWPDLSLADTAQLLPRRHWASSRSATPTGS